MSQVIIIRFAETLERPQREARAKGLGPTTLVRMWILERLQVLEQPSALRA
jgi:hypothetical protein